MEKSSLKRPTTLEEGKEYLLQETLSTSFERILCRILFVRYDPCPAIVIVYDGTTKKRCTRDDLFIQA